MSSDHMRVCAHINLDNIIHNLKIMSERIDNTPVMAVIKTDGYGHGAVPIAKVLEDKPFILGYAVATLEEGIELREAGCKKPILNLGYIFHDDYKLMLAHDIMPAIFTYEDAAALDDIAYEQGITCKIHIKIDTGMHRIGFLCNEKSIDDIARINKLQNITIDGIFTHFSKADELDKEPTHEAYNKFMNMVNAVNKNGVTPNYVHCGNSASIIDFTDYKCDFMRAGITTYGLWPSDDTGRDIDIRPALSLISHISFVKKLPAGEPISYGGTYVTEGERVIATVPVGYGDGYPRSLSNKGYVLIKGQKARIVGRVCMDQFMVDVTDIADVKQGEKVTLIGFDGDNHISCEELGDLSGRFNYELVCDLNKRVPRVYD